MGSPPEFLTIQILSTWVEKAESALRHYGEHVAWAEQIGHFFYRSMYSPDTRGEVSYLEMIYSDGQKDSEELWRNLEVLFWQYAVLFYKANISTISDKVSEIVCMAEDYTIDEWGLSSE